MLHPKTSRKHGFILEKGFIAILENSEYLLRLLPQHHPQLWAILLRALSMQRLLRALSMQRSVCECGSVCHSLRRSRNTHAAWPRQRHRTHMQSAHTRSAAHTCNAARTCSVVHMRTSYTQCRTHTQPADSLAELTVKCCRRPSHAC